MIKKEKNNSRPQRRWLGALSIVCILLLGASCGKEQAAKKRGGESPPDGRLVIVTTLFPLYDWCRVIAGDRADVSLLLPPGVEPHSFEPTPRDMSTFSRADLFVYTSDIMEPWAKRFATSAGGHSGGKVVEASKGIELIYAEHDDDDHGHDHHGHAHTADPHVWLDPVRAQQMVRNLVEAIAAADPAHADEYRQRGEAYIAELDTLDKDFAKLLPTCKGNTIVFGGHFNFGYFAARYHLNCVSAYKGFSPDAKPTPRDMAAVISLMKEKELTVIFHSELLNQRVAEVIAEETGAQLKVLHGAHNVRKDELAQGATYLSIMEANMESLKKGLACP